MAIIACPGRRTLRGSSRRWPKWGNRKKPREYRRRLTARLPGCFLNRGPQGRHRFALRQGGDCGCSDRAKLVIEETLADRDALAGLMVYDLEADPLLHWQAVQVKGDIAVDVAEPLIAGIRERAGKISGNSDSHKWRQRLAVDKVAHFAHPELPWADGAHRPNNRTGRPLAVHAEPRIGRRGNFRWGRNVPVRRRPHCALRSFGLPQQLARSARHRGSAANEIRLDHLDAQAIADQSRLDFDRRRCRQPKHVHREPRWHEIIAAMALLDRESQKANDDAAVQRIRIPWP